MTDRPATARGAELESLLGRLADEFLYRRERGERPDPEEYATRHPEAADVIRRALGSLRLVESVADGPDLAGESIAEGVLGDYRIVREVGRGGMGVVYEAEQLSLRRRVALKVLPFAAVLDPRHLQRFRNEALAAAGLDHPNVVKVYGVGCERGVHFIALQYIDGRPLADLIRDRRGGPAAESRTLTFAAEPTEDSPAATPSTGERTALDGAYADLVARWGVQAAEALEHAHGLGIVHRDVKPGNLLVDGRGELYVADFGLAKVLTDPGPTAAGDLLGTVRYMSPEQAASRHDLVDHRSDVYSLGATLYELLTLTPAFDGTDRQEILSRVADSDPVSPRTLERSVPRDLENIVLKAMEKDPARRYPSAQELADDLRRFLSHEPVRAQQATLAHRARKWGRRHPAVVRSAALALTLAAVGSSVGTWLVWREKDRTADALAAATAARTRADEEKRTAQDRDAETTALLRFFEDRILAPVRPEGQDGGLGHDVKLRQAIEAALPAVDREFADKPLLQARLRRTIGLSFKYLGEAKAAVEQFELARALYATHRGPDHPDTLAVVNNLANGYEALGQHDDALRLREETLALRRARLGPDHPDSLASETNLASSYERLGRHDDALKLREETLRSTQARLGPDHADTLRGMNNLGISYTVLGRHEKALELREAVLAQMKAQFGPDHPNTLACRHNLAESYHALSRCGDALRLYEGTLELAKVKLPPDHEKTLLVMNNLAWLLATAQDDKVRDPARAVELAEKAARLSADNADYRGTLGTARYRTGDYQQAVRDLETAIRLRGPDDPASGNEAFVLAMACRQLGDGPTARAWFAKADAWLAKAKTRTDEMRRFRAEAARLLGLEDGTNRSDGPPK